MRAPPALATALDTLLGAAGLATAPPGAAAGNSAAVAAADPSLGTEDTEEEVGRRLRRFATAEILRIGVHDVAAAI